MVIIGSLTFTRGMLDRCLTPVFPKSVPVPEAKLTLRNIVNPFAPGLIFDPNIITTCKRFAKMQITV